MRTSELDSELTLELARRASGPSDADRARNLSALRDRLELAPKGAGRPAALARRGPWRAALAAGATGVVGFVLGLLAASPRASSEDAEREAPRGAAPAEPAARAPGELGADVSSPAPASSSAAPPSALPVAPPGGREAALADPTSGRASVARAEPDRSGVVERRRQGSGAAAPPGKSVRSPASRAAFGEAVRLLRRAERAVWQGEGALGLSLLEQLDERFPPELLAEERAATRVLGLCAVDEVGAARQLASTLLERNSRSIYAARLRESCALEPAGGAAASPADRAAAAARRAKKPRGERE